MFKKFGFWFLNAIVAAVAFSTLLLIFLTEGVAGRLARNFTPLEILSFVGLPILTVVLILWLLHFIDGRRVEVIAANGILFVTLACVALFYLVGSKDASLVGGNGA